MKTIRKYLLAACFLAVGVLAVSSCGGIKQLKTPENLRIENEILSWDPVEHAKEYFVEVNDMTFQIKEDHFDLLETVIEPDTYTICVTAVGDLIDYSDSERSEGIEYVVQSAVEFIACTGTSKLGTCSITGQNAEDFVGKLVIPPVIEGCNVWKIMEGAFENCKNLTSVYLPDFVERIESYAFANCTNLTRVRFPKSMRYLKTSSFRNCGFTEFSVPEGVEILTASFRGCKKLSKLELPASLSSFDISDYSTGSFFQGCLALEHIEVAADNPVYRSEGNCIIRRESNEVIIGCKTSVIPQGIEKISTSAFNKCQGLTEVFIPDSVTFIPSNPFKGVNDLERIEVAAGNPVYRSEGNCVIRKEDGEVVIGCKTSVIPQGVKTIGSYAFAHLDSMTSIEIPDSVTEIGNSAFNGCTGLTAITIPGSVTKIGNSAFYECAGLTAITIPDSVMEIGSSAFYGCTGLTELTLGDGLTTIGTQAFLGCSRLSAVTIPRSVQNIGDEAFWDCYACFIVPASLVKNRNAFYGSIIYTDAEVNSGDIIWSSTIYGCQFGYDGNSPYVISWEYKLLPSFIPGQFEKQGINAGGTPVPVRAGYEFLGWATEEGGEVVYVPQDIIVKFESSGGRPSSAVIVFRKVWRVAIYGEEEFNSLALGTVLYAVWRPLKS